MGFGEFGSNESMHWKVTDNDAVTPADQIDDIAYDNIGKGKGGGAEKKHHKFIQVRLRFNNVQEFEAAVSKAIKEPQAEGYFVYIDVPVVFPKRNKQQMKELRWEVKVDW
jgi:hypothetical protein